MENLISDEQATGKTKAIFEDIRSHFSMAPNFFRAQAAKDPEMLESNWQRWKTGTLRAF